MAKETHNKALHLITDLRRENHIRKRRSKHPETRKRRKSPNVAIIAFGFCFCFKVKGDALRILRTNSSKNTIEENISKFKRHLWDRGYPRDLVEKLRVLSAWTKEQNTKRYFTFCDTIPTNSVKLKTNFTHKMTFNSKSTPTSPNF